MFQRQLESLLASMGTRCSRDSLRVSLACMGTRCSRDSLRGTGVSLGSWSVRYEEIVRGGRRERRRVDSLLVVHCICLNFICRSAVSQLITWVDACKEIMMLRLHNRYVYSVIHI